MMKRQIFLALFLSTFLAIACNNSSTEHQTDTPEAGPDGKKIYKTYCVTCHGLYGDMGAAGAYDLSASTLSLEDRIVVITKGRNTMTAFETLLTEKQIKAVAEYTFNLNK